MRDSSMRHVAIRGTPIGVLIPRLLGVALFLAIPVALLFAALAPAAHVHAVAEGGIGCPFRAATTLPCPFCNMTHATLALGQGDVALALAYHPLAFVVLALWMWACLELARGARSMTSRTSRRIITPAVLGVVIAVIWASNLINHYLRM